MTQPNILVILADQLRRGALSIYGDPNVATPAIDKMASSGVRFSNACSTFPICVPFRFTLVTGEYAHSRFVPAIEWRMSPAERTLADEFNQAGYHTTFIGKWHLYGGHAHLPEHTEKKTNRTWIPPLHQGRWRRWLGFELANNPYETYYFEDADPTPKKLAGYQTDGLFDLAILELIQRAASPQPFFCILSVEPPHFPLIAPPEFTQRWQDREMTLPPNYLYQDQHPAPGRTITNPLEALENRRKYYAMIENLDWNVARLMSVLQKSGLDQNTIVMLVSDHGQMDGAHNCHSTIKDHPFEEAVGIPWIVTCPSLLPLSNRVIDEPTCTEDFFPTLLGLAGLSPSKPLLGLDLSPLIRGEAKRTEREGVLLEFTHDLRPRSPYFGVYWRAYRTRRYKYTVLGDARRGGSPWQFFDLENDPYEMNNLVDDPSMDDVIAHHHRALRSRLIETSDHYVLAPAFGCDGLNLWDWPKDTAG